MKGLHFGSNSAISKQKFKYIFKPIEVSSIRFREGSSEADEVSGDVYSRIVVDVFLERPLGYFMWEVYMPATSIVVISWTSFWLERSAIPARVSLGVTTVLSITTLLSNSNDNLPPTAYPTVINEGGTRME